ncbi:DUF1636 domain-containing protein [Chelatococcus sp. SYSU_G07232]|uniref:DUF1636 domain-containing protein n=1 Tax=Chelatococcus albus TaxID=3047466 RepID=A0ABT7AHI5_9HYPH|nr:DUF1636 domain-containing protein [Chelatococcus sp. SYSU_G07232]MDJ1158832.1 DUF1636 domain-containing protein [Chelatococcus sp. SYSU_G07232]
MSERSDVTIFVCVACRRRTGEGERAFDEPGRALVAALEERLAGGAATGVVVTPVECLAVCSRPCTVALSGGGKWTYLVGDLDAEAHADDILAAAKSFAATDNGIIPWKERPQAFRKGVVARVPPLGFRSFGDPS